MGRAWWRGSVASRRAVKELCAEPHSPATGSEVTFTSHLVAAWVRLPASLPAPDGRFVVRADGGWLRLYRWVDGAPVDLDGDDVPGRLGALLGSLHANALPPSGEVDPWYETAPDPATWEPLVQRGREAPWGRHLAAALAFQEAADRYVAMCERRVAEARYWRAAVPGDLTQREVRT